MDSNKFLNETLKDYTYTLNESNEEYVERHGSDSDYLDEDENYYDERNLIDTLDKDFSKTIKERGEAYYNDGNVQNVYKSGNRYITKVDGSDDDEYDVEITIIDEKNANYECSCPCTFPCKHEYAALIAISNLEYSEVELKPTIKDVDVNLKAIIERIPAERIKEYLLSPVGLDNVVIEMRAFSDYFRIYYPRPSYAFYYNNLYNEMVLNEDYIGTIFSYLSKARYYLSYNEFDEVFKIVESIIGAYIDSKRLNFDDYAFEIMNKLGMLLRITYRKASDDTKQDIKAWASILESNNFYNNYYLEDLILSLSINR